MKIYEKKKGLGFFYSFFPPSSLSFFPCISSPETPVSKNPCNENQKLLEKGLVWPREGGWFRWMDGLHD